MRRVMHRRQSQGMVTRPPTLRETAEPPLPEVDENFELHPSRFEVFRWRLNDFLNQGHMMLLVLRTHVHDFNPHYAAEFEHAVLFYSMIKVSLILSITAAIIVAGRRRVASGKVSAELAFGGKLSALPLGKDYFFV
ncbi:hypothetical protein MTO96_044907 [Rhipicephalus appendiculatus]